MKNLDALFKECLKEVEAAGIEVGNIISVVPNTKAKDFWGICKHMTNGNIIEISVSLLQDSVSDIATKNTIIHEILHTVVDGAGHKGGWKRAAKIINATYPQYNIKRCTPSEEKGIEEHKSRYDVICTGCGNVYHYDRAGKVVQNPSHYRCGKCKGNLKVVCNIEGMQIWSAANRER